MRLSNLVTSTFVLDGSGNVKEFVGGYDDWHMQIDVTPISSQNPKPEPAPRATATAPAETQPSSDLGSVQSGDTVESSDYLYFEALAAGRRVKALWVKLRGQGAMVSAMLALLPKSLIRLVLTLFS